MEVTKIKVTRSGVHIEYENNGDTYKYDSSDCPLKSFYDSLEAIQPIVLNTLGLPKSYAGKKPTAGDKEPGLPLTVSGITLTTKGESRLVTIQAKKIVSSSPSPFNISTPLRYLDAPTEEGSCSEPLSTKEASLIEDLIQEAKNYIKGERAQGTLPLEQDDEYPVEESEPSNGNTLEFPQTGTE